MLPVERASPQRQTVIGTRSLFMAQLVLAIIVKNRSETAQITGSSMPRLARFTRGMIFNLRMDI